MSKTQEPVGEQIGEYRLLHQLGRSSSGTVYLAEHVSEHTRVVVKLFHVPPVSGKAWQDFLSEVRSPRLQHPHIMPLLDFGMHREKVPFLVMEYAAGGTLREYCEHEKQLSFAAIITYTTQLASALQYAHDRQIIHRDVRPANMLLRTDGTLLLSDFGVARILEQSTTIGSSPIHAGILAYMAPEQRKGQPGTASDQYALAVVIYEWITGQRPFVGAPMEAAIQHRLEALPSLYTLRPGVSARVEQVLLQALAKTPAERFATVERFAQELCNALEEIEAVNLLTQQLAPLMPVVSTDEPLPLEHTVSAAIVTNDEAKVAEKKDATTGHQAKITQVMPLATSAQTPAPLLPLIDPATSSQVTDRPVPPRRSPVYSRIGLFLLLVLLLTGGGMLYFALRQVHPAQVTNPVLTTKSGTASFNLATVTSGQQIATPATNTTPILPAITPTHTESTSTPSSASIVPATWRKVLNDPLTTSNHDSLWEADDVCIFQASGYEEKSTGSNYCAHGNASISSSVFSDQYYRIDLSIQQGKQGGLIFRNQDDNYYYFSITTTGNYSLSLHQSADGGEDTQIVGGSSSTIHQGQNQWNRLAVLAQGNSFMLYINGVYVNTATDSTRGQGIIGIAVNGPGPQDVFGDVLFKNAVVWVP